VGDRCFHDYSFLTFLKNGDRLNTIYIYIYIYIYIGVRGSPERGYFVPGCVGSGRWADFESCSRIHACGFRCFCRKVWFRARGAHYARRETSSHRGDMKTARLHLWQSCKRTHRDRSCSWKIAILHAWKHGNPGQPAGIESCDSITNQSLINR